ncbi:MAG: GxxExxY protein, partial [candidate division NC10 bacterium]
MDINALSKEIIGAAMQVHRALGPGLLEGAYEACLAHELAARELKLTGLQLGLLINFNVTILQQGIRRVVLG